MTAAPITIERVDSTSLSPVLPLLVLQMKEHGIDIGDQAMGQSGFARAVRALVEVPGRGVILSASAEGEGSPVGVAVLAHTWTIEQGGLCTWLDELYVVPHLRSKGIGSALLRRAIEVASEEGCRAIDLEVDVDHTRAERLYERAGFRPFRRRHFTLPLR